MRNAREGKITQFHPLKARCLVQAGVFDLQQSIDVLARYPASWLAVSQICCENGTEMRVPEALEVLEKHLAALRSAIENEREPVRACGHVGASMTDDAWKLPASFAVQRFARRCKEHPRIEDDPVCVIETEKERMLAEIEAAEVAPEEAVIATVKEVHPGGARRKRA